MIVAIPTDEPMQWGEFARSHFLSGTPSTAEELAGKVFDILRAERFDSSFEGQNHAWFCVVRVVGETEVYSVTLGGQVVVPILDAYAGMGSTRPLRVKLTHKSGGKYGGYYTFE